MTEPAQQAIEILLARALKDELPIEEAIRFQAELGRRTQKELSLVHAIIHFISDLDIRRTDAEYDRLQREDLKAQLRSL